MTKSKIILLFFISALLLAQCAPTIDYSMQSVPEEGGIRLTRFTSETENTEATGVFKDQKGYLKWEAFKSLAISPDGNKLAFIRETNNQYNIFIKNTTGGTSATQRTFRAAVDEVCFSPDGNNIAFSEFVNNYKHIYMMHASEGSAVQQITQGNDYDDMNPVFSADGEMIFFSRIQKSFTTYQTKSGGTSQGNFSYSGTYSIWSYNLKTGLVTQYDEGFDPCPLADGKSILIARANKNTGLGEIWEINIATGAVTEILASNNMGFSNPQISPDGKKIVVEGATPTTTNRPVNLDIYTLNLDGTGQTQLTFHPAQDFCPVWGPDGKSIYFISGRASKEQKYNVWQMIYNK